MDVNNDEVDIINKEKRETRENNEGINYTSNSENFRIQLSGSRDYSCASQEGLRLATTSHLPELITSDFQQEGNPASDLPDLHLSYPSPPRQIKVLPNVAHSVQPYFPRTQKSITTSAPPVYTPTPLPKSRPPVPPVNFSMTPQH